MRTAAVGGGATIALVALAAPAGAAGGAPTRTVWRLNPDWGYPLGPDGRTSVKSNASRNHAANKVFATADDAIAGRHHVCSLAQPTPVEICASSYNGLWSFSRDGGRSVDLRYPGVAEVWAEATTGACADKNASAGGANRSPRVKGSLPRTGVGPGRLLAAGLGAVAAGGVLTVVARRRALAPAVDDGEHPPT